MSNQTIFESTGMDDPLGLWTPAASQAVSFSVGDSESNVPEPVFRVNLPDTTSATDSLSANEKQIVRLNAALNAVPARLNGLVARTQARRQKGVSFEAGSVEPAESGLEADLLAALESPDAGVSFGIGETTSAAIEQAKTGLTALTEQIHRDMLHFAWVETNVAGSLIARTTIAWAGNTQTVFVQEPEESQVALHSRILRIATQTRHLRLRLLITIAGGAAKVSALAATPGGAVLALPATYQYVMKIVAQVKQLQAIQSS